MKATFFLVRRTTGAMKEAIVNLSKLAKKMGLAINLKNTRYMETRKWSTNSRMLKVDDHEFERVRELKDLGSILTRQ
jgi:hypothetical protein